MSGALVATQLTASVCIVDSELGGACCVESETTHASLPDQRDH
ncbi:hypothetical protein A2U01_0119206, partial [Trifolium medium]|nr:hypothetical protein [Trifolium medium]